MKKILTFILCSLPLMSYALETGLVAVEGNSRYEVEPDVLKISVRIANINIQSVADAKNDVDSRSNKVVAALLGAGVKEDTIRSSAFNLNVNNNFDNNGCPKDKVPEVSRSIEFELHNIKDYVKVTDLLVKNGITSIDNIEEALSKTSKEQDKAVALAMEDAKRQAKVMAEGFGAKLGKIKNIGHRRVSGSNNIEGVMMASMRASPKADVLYDFKPAKVEISASVYAEFELE